MSDILEKLKAPFPPERIKWRIGTKTKDCKKAQALAYIEARTTMERLDEVVGPYWRDEYHQQGERTLCTISLYVDGMWISRTDGAGDTNFEGIKGGISDAFKRAGVKWGIARYLYGLDSPWLEITDQGKYSKFTPASLKRLNDLAGKFYHGSQKTVVKRKSAVSPTSTVTSEAPSPVDPVKVARERVLEDAKRWGIGLDTLAQLGNVAFPGLSRADWTKDEWETFHQVVHNKSTEAKTTPREQLTKEITEILVTLDQSWDDARENYNEIKGVRLNKNASATQLMDFKEFLELEALPF